MNVFSIGLIYRSYALREQIERVNPKKSRYKRPTHSNRSAYGSIWWTTN